MKIYDPGCRLVFFVMLVIILQSCAGWDPSANMNQKGLHYSNDTISAVTIDKFVEVDPAIQSFVDDAYAMAVLPKIAKAGLTVGGAYGKGRLYVNQVLAGTASLKQLSYGLSIGWQKYRQLVFLKINRHWIKRWSARLNLADNYLML